MYSLMASSDEKPKCALKGIGRSYVKKHVTHERFVRTLETKVDINPAVPAKLADRGSLQAAGLVMDAASFLKELAIELGWKK